MAGTATEPLRIGVIGGGHIGLQIGKRFESDPRATVVALTEIDDSTRTKTGKRLDIPPESRFGDYEVMLDAESLDAVLIATPHTLHYDQIIDAFEHGLDVLCEKPLTTNLSHARDLATLAADADEVLMVGYQRHINPAFQRARKRWAKGDLTPTFITAEITQRWVSRFADAWRTDPELSGGGFLYDTGSHLLDALLWTTGLTPESLTAEMDFIDDDQQVDERAHMTIEFVENATATISTYGDAPAVREHMHVWDGDGAIYLNGRHWDPRTVMEIKPDNTEVHPYVDHRNKKTKAEAFLNTIIRRTEPPATATDALRVTAVTEAAYEAARTDTRVKIDL